MTYSRGLVDSSMLSAQVRWQQPVMIRHGIDQTRLILEDVPTQPGEFSFLVMGDTDAGTDAGNGAHQSSTFAEGFASQLLAQVKESQFLLHTGDVTYPIGSYENYLNGFLKPYRALTSSLPASPAYAPMYDRKPVVFNRPLLPVPGNHDYGTVRSPLWNSFLRGVCDRLRQTLGIDFGHYGGEGGEAYGQTFLDDLASLSPDQLKIHLHAHYGVDSETISAHAIEEIKAGLRYKVGRFTRLPNRYYSFRCGGVDFFALDSNTWKTSSDVPGFDHEQLEWLEQSLLRSVRSPETVGRIIYLHHSPYTTEISRWQQSDTLWVRRHLRGVLARVRQKLTQKMTHRAYSQRLVDLVISGHAHCLEHLQTIENTADNDHADAGMDWIVCGGSGASVRPQWRTESADLLENVQRQGRSYPKVVAKSRIYVGNHLKKNKKQSLYSFIRVDVRPQQIRKFRVIPYVVSRRQSGWQTKQLRDFKTNVSRQTSDCHA